ncbi:MAG TPA: NUDIX domain-containing protein [Candidatus Limnocylindria bacterium]|nr:NUDIX domain-containing protein [Candidatus Limnocylindria bacterium]
MIRNVIFDWSGTLVDDLPAVWAASNHCFTRAGIEPLTLDRFRAEFQFPLRDFYLRFAGHIPPRQLEAWFHEKFAMVKNDVVPLPYTRDFLEFCRERGLRTLVLSALPEAHYAEQSQTTGFGPFLQHPYLGVSDKRERIHDVLKQNGLVPGETLFIGDMSHDIEAAHAGGVASVAVLTGYNTLPQLRAAKPDLIVEHLGELRRILETNGMELRNPSATPAMKRFPLATVGALIFDEQGLILLVRTNKWSGLWGIPGGKIEWAETSEDALRREVLEETGLAIHDIQFVMVQDAIHPPEFYRDVHFLLLNYTAVAGPGQAVRLNSEGQAYQWVTPDAAARLPLNTPTRILLEAVMAQRHG